MINKNIVCQLFCLTIELFAERNGLFSSRDNFKKRLDKFQSNQEVRFDWKAGIIGDIWNYSFIICGMDMDSQPESIILLMLVEKNSTLGRNPLFTQPIRFQAETDVSLQGLSKQSNSAVKHETLIELLILMFYQLPMKIASGNCFVLGLPTNGILPAPSVRATSQLS